MTLLEEFDKVQKERGRYPVNANAYTKWLEKELLKARTKAENLPISDVSPRYFKIQTYDGGQKESPIIIKGKNKTEAISEFRMKNPHYMNRLVDFICEINED